MRRGYLSLSDARYFPSTRSSHTTTQSIPNHWAIPIKNTNCRMKIATQPAQLDRLENTITSDAIARPNIQKNLSSRR